MSVHMVMADNVPHSLHDWGVVSHETFAKEQWKPSSKLSFSIECFLILGCWVAYFFDVLGFWAPIRLP